LSSINFLEHYGISNTYKKWGGEKKHLYNSLLQVFSLVTTAAIGYTAIATSATAEISQQDHLIIAQFAPRGREFVCEFKGSSGTTITPNISGSFIHDIYCYIPAQGRQCVAVYDGIFGSVTGSDWNPCNNNNMKIVTDPNTGKSYYRLNPGRFIFSK
jgi:hypothetical protein